MHVYANVLIIYKTDINYLILLLKKTHSPGIEPETKKYIPSSVG